MMFHRKDLVDMAKAPVGPGSALANEEGPAAAFIGLTGPWDRNLAQLKATPGQFAEHTAASDGVVGDASLATREKGERIFEAIVENAVTFVEGLRDEPVSLRNVDILI